MNLISVFVPKSAEPSKEFRPTIHGHIFDLSTLQILVIFTFRAIRRVMRGYVHAVKKKYIHQCNIIAPSNS